MKGLLLKDRYMMNKYCRAYLVIAIVFIAVSLVSNDNMFFIFYPCLLCGMIPVNLLAYDERSRWLQYSCTLPYSREQFVSAKYLIGLLAQVAMLIVTGIAQAIKMSVTGNFIIGNFIVLILSMLIISTFTSSIALPFIFKMGVEKGRIAYFVMIGFVCSASFLASNLFKGQFESKIQPKSPFAVLAVVGIGVYIFSWFLSVRFFKKREIN